MRHRISEALEKAISQNPSSQHLRKQLGLMNRASISTLHSFCLDVIRKYYYVTDIDPGFRIGDSTEMSCSEMRSWRIYLKNTMDK